MKKTEVSVPKVACRAVFALGCFVFIQLVGARDARAESTREVEGFEVLGTLGYGVAVGDPTWWDKEVDPYDVMVGLDLGYTWPFGLRLGAEASHGFGRRSEETRSTGDVSSTGLGGSVGYEGLLSSFRLRGAADAGMLFFDGEGVLRKGAAYFIGPEVALIWQYRTFELGLQSKFWVTTGDHSVVQVGLVSGARF